MGKMVAFDIVSRETIKPSSSTPEHLKYSKLSLLDQMSFAMSNPLVLFYPNSTPAKELQTDHLKSSLSKALSILYPIAGIVKDNTFIECNDNGVDYVEARVGCLMSDLFDRPRSSVIEKLSPFYFNSNEDTWPGAIIQVNMFDCGGLAIGVRISHKIGDAALTFALIMSWAAAAAPADKGRALSYNLHPHFVSDTIIPSIEVPLALLKPQLMHPKVVKWETMRLTFCAAKIALLKAQTTSQKVQKPTRVEVVTAIIWKCLMQTSKSKLGRARDSFLFHALNLRKRFDPPLPENYLGNLTGRFLAQTTISDHIELKDLVILLRERLEKTSEQIAKVGRENWVPFILEFAKEFGELHTRDDVDFYSFSSLCGGPLYEVDFGWGKPTWVAVTNSLLKQFVVLVDSRDGIGVEAWLSLSGEDVTLLERNQELLSYASINMSVDVAKTNLDN